MVKTDEIRMPLTSADLLGERIKALREIFPEVFTEGRIDFDRLRLALGDQVDDGPERYGLTWPGKAEAVRAIQTPSTGTLTPMPGESVNFDTADNLIIEGDNLEVLKLLQKSYHGKVKMIYIDPPYNTGNEFIYPDNFREGLQDYLRYSGQIGNDGIRRSTNAEAGGRYHSNWLTMIYPRLFLARNLLRPDGVIFVSIDDHEVHNLRHILDGVFGDENFLGTIVWKKKTNGNNMGFIPPVHDYFLCYAKQASEKCLLGFPLEEDYIARTYSNPDSDPRGPWTTSDLSANHKGPYFRITNPASGQHHYPAPGRYWVFNEEEVARRIRDGRIIFGKSGTSGPVQKKFLSERPSMRRKAESWWDKHGLNEDGTAELADLIGLKVFEHPKPSETLQHLCNIATRDDDIILDFFAGSGTIAHSTLNLNRQDGGNRRFILIQLPEPSNNSEYKTIADICRERVRRVIKKLADADTAHNGGSVPGFRAFKLTSSNFKVWDADQTPQEADGLAQQLELYADHLLPGRTRQDVLYELILKFGLELTVPIEPVQVGGGTAFMVDGDNLLICLEDRLSEEMLRAMMALEPVRVVCLDQAFGGNDQLKTNTSLEMTSHGIEFRTV